MAEPIDTVADWSRGFPPRSRDNGDVYFSAGDGLAESRAVFLAGCGLPEAWRDRDRFCIGELGFGSGLNIAALIDLWRRDGPACGHLHIFSIERAPLSAEEAVRALGVWPELSAVAERMLDAWPRRNPGFHRLAFADWRVSLDLAVMEAGEALNAWSGHADAWFLDGFSPSLDPQIWREEVLQLIAARSAPGARVATYTVAGAVRRGLAQAGFQVERRPGHARKRERLEAVLPAGPARAAQAGPIAIIGAGIAGAAAAAALRALGRTAQVFEAVGAGAGASGVPIALSTPRLDAGLGPAARLFAQAAEFAASAYDGIGGAVAADEALQLARDGRDEARFAVIAASNLFDPSAVVLTPDETLARLGESAPSALRLPHARVVRPARVLEVWLGGVEAARISAVSREAEGWMLASDAGDKIGPFASVVVAAGPASAMLTAGIPITPVRGQVSIARGVSVAQACSGEAYVIPVPTDGGEGEVVFGATYDREDSADETRPQDDQRNLELIGRTLPQLARRLAAARIRSWAGVRAATPDNLPLAGAAPGQEAGLFVLSGLGSRGLVLSPLLGAHVGAMAAGAPSPLPRDLAMLVDPGRFAARAARKNKLRFSPSVEPGARSFVQATFSPETNTREE